jgi:hypothetical protein
MSCLERPELLHSVANDGSTLRTSNTRREQADPVRHHQFDYTFRSPDTRTGRAHLLALDEFGAYAILSI